MANTIQTISANQVIQMQNGRFARKIDTGILSSYTRIRVAILASAADFGANPTGPLVFIGFSSGTSAIYGDDSVTHTLGMQLSGSSWIRQAGPPVAYSSLVSKGCVKVGTSETLTAAYSNASMNVTNRAMMSVDIETGSPNYRVYWFRPSVATAADVTETQFDEQVLMQTQTLSGHASSSNVIACDEAANGYFDSVNVSWNFNSPVLYIHKMTVIKIS